MGFSLPLQLRQSDTDHTFGFVTVVLIPILSALIYVLTSKLGKRAPVIDWVRSCSQSGLVAYMLALQTF